MEVTLLVNGYTTFRDDSILSQERSEELLRTGAEHVGRAARAFDGGCSLRVVEAVRAEVPVPVELLSPLGGFTGLHRCLLRNERGGCQVSGHYLPRLVAAR